MAESSGVILDISSQVSLQVELFHFAYLTVITSPEIFPWTATGEDSSHAFGMTQGMTLIGLPQPQHSNGPLLELPAPYISKNTVSFSPWSRISKR